MTALTTDSTPQDHGGDIYSKDPIPVLRDFSASINPLGHPEGLVEAICASWAESLHYPDRRCTEFLNSLPKRYPVDPKNTLAGNGSAQLLDLAVRALATGRLLICPPDFGLYTRFTPPGVETVTVPRREETGFGVDAEELTKALEPGDLVLFSNPGNPSGGALPRETVLNLAQTAQSKGAYLLVDEAFADYCPSRSVLDTAAHLRSLLVLRSLTKFYGIPGLRLGFIAGAPELLARMERLAPPWSVSTVAQTAGIHCMADEHWGDKSRTYLVRAREKFLADLSALPGIEPLHTEANYVTLRLTPPAPDADRMYLVLKNEGTLVRHCGSFGLGNRYVRLAIRTVGENADLVRHLKAFYR